MIVFASQRDHHYSEDVNQGTANKKPLRTKLVEHEAPLQAHVRDTHTLRATRVKARKEGEHTIIGKKFKTHCMKLVIHEMVDEEY